MQLLFNFWHLSPIQVSFPSQTAPNEQHDTALAASPNSTPTPVSYSFTVPELLLLPCLLHYLRNYNSYSRAHQAAIYCNRQRGVTDWRLRRPALFSGRDGYIYIYILIYLRRFVRPDDALRMSEFGGRLETGGAQT